MSWEDILKAMEGQTFETHVEPSRSQTVVFGTVSKAKGFHMVGYGEIDLSKMKGDVTLSKVFMQIDSRLRTRAKVLLISPETTPDPKGFVHR